MRYTFFVISIISCYIIFPHSMQCMDISTYSKTIKTWIPCNAKTITPIMFTFASCMQNVSGYIPGTPEACYSKCIANCTEYMPPLCNPFILPIGIISGEVIFFTCTGVFFGSYITKYIKNYFEKRQNQLSESKTVSDLINTDYA